jgi:hypothetical protein
VPIFKHDECLHLKQFINKFNNDGSVLDRKCHQPSSVCSPENIDAVRVGL